MTDAPIPAATVLLLRDRTAFEVLMIARHENSVFAGGALVFPGGRLDPGDFRDEWNDLAAGLSSDKRIAASQVAAIREAFEEAGVLLARDETGRMITAERLRGLNDWRANIEKNDLLFLELVRAERLTLACDALHLFSHWVAPPGLHRRFDTLFFAAAFPDGQFVMEDGNEATESVWISPAAALEARKTGDRKIIFPTACNLGLLSVGRNIQETIEWAARRDIRPITPTVVFRAGEPFLKIPDGLGYPLTEEPLEFARPS